MCEKETFRVEYPTGYIQINVGKFFGSADHKSINGLLRYARKYCSDERRMNLLTSLRNEFAYRNIILEELGELEHRRFQLLSKLFNGDIYLQRPLASPEKAIVRQKERLSQYAEKLMKERWNT